MMRYLGENVKGFMLSIFNIFVFFVMYIDIYVLED